MPVPYSVTPRAVTVFLKGKYVSVDASNPNYRALREAVLAKVQDETAIAKLANIETFYAHITHGRVTIGNDGEERQVRFDGKPVHSTVPKRILELLDGGYDIMPLVKFLEKVEQNPTVTARAELFDWLESGNNPITPEGNFLAFKMVNMDYTSIHRGTGPVVHNDIGTSPSMPREEVDADRNNTCSRGLHFCSYGYLNDAYGGSGYRLIVVEVNPTDVVAIPNDYQFQKGRTWTYKVVGEIQREKAATFFEGKPVVALEDSAPVLAGERGYTPTLSAFGPGQWVRCIAAHVGDFLKPGVGYQIIAVNDEGDEVVVKDDRGTEWTFDAMQFVKTDYDRDDYPGVENSADDSGDPPGTEDPVESETVSHTGVEVTAPILHTLPNGETVTAEELVALKQTYGSERALCRALGLARSTVQGWFKKAGL